MPLISSGILMMIKQICKFRPLQILVRFWRQARQPRKVHKAELRLLEERFYISLLEQPGVREVVSKLRWDAEVAAISNGRYYEIPKSTRLLVAMSKSMWPNPEDINSDVASAVRYVLSNRADNRELWTIFLLYLAALLLSIIMPR